MDANTYLIAVPCLLLAVWLLPMLITTALEALKEHRAHRRIVEATTRLDRVMAARYPRDNHRLVDWATQDADTLKRANRGE